jgi:hypothetical protein
MHDSAVLVGWHLIGRYRREILELLQPAMKAYHQSYKEHTDKYIKDENVSARLIALHCRHGCCCRIGVGQSSPRRLYCFASVVGGHSCNCVIVEIPSPSLEMRAVTSAWTQSGE